MVALKTDQVIEGKLEAPGFIRMVYELHESHDGANASLLFCNFK